eukprot:978896-Amorphochlora_amoeboformis.AAC.1
MPYDQPGTHGRGYRDLTKREVPTALETIPTTLFTPSTKTQRYVHWVGFKRGWKSGSQGTESERMKERMEENPISCEEYSYSCPPLKSIENI